MSQDTTPLVTGLLGMATHLRRMVDGAAFVRDGHVCVKDPDYLATRIEEAAAEITSLREALAEIAAIEPVPLSEAEVAPAIFRKLNDAMKLARAALRALGVPS